MLSQGLQRAPNYLLEQAIAHARARLEKSRQTKERIRILWAAAKNSRDLGPADAIHNYFMTLAVDINLIDSNGRWTGTDVRENVRRFGEADVSHAITWALRGMNPFENGLIK